MKTLPPGYVKLVERMVELIPEWCGEQGPGLPDLQWHDWGDTMFAAGLDSAKYLAASPDALRLLAWLDEKTERKGTLIQARQALKMLGHIQDSNAPAPEAVLTSKALDRLTHFAKATGTTTAVPPSPCGHCSALLEYACGEPGNEPVPGCFSICVKCGGINQFGEQLQHLKVTEQDLESQGIPEEFRAELREQQTLMRQARLQYRQSRKPGKAVQA